jgi:hypothetical protein
MAYSPTNFSVQYNHKSAVKIAFQLIPLEKLSSQAFDLSQLPFGIMQGIEVADVSSLLPPRCLTI